MKLRGPALRSGIKAFWERLTFSQKILQYYLPPLATYFSCILIDETKKTIEMSMEPVIASSEDQKILQLPAELLGKIEILRRVEEPVAVIVVKSLPIFLLPSSQKSKMKRKRDNYKKKISTYT